MLYIFKDKKTGNKIVLNRNLSAGQLYEIYRDGFILVKIIKK